MIDSKAVTNLGPIVLKTDGQPAANPCKSQLTALEDNHLQVRAQNAAAGPNSTNSLSWDPFGTHNCPSKAQQIARCQQEILRCRQNGREAVSPAEKWGAMQGEIDWMVALQMAEELPA